MWTGMFREVAPPKISRSYLLTRVAGLQSTGCNAAKKELLNKFS